MIEMVPLGVETSTAAANAVDGVAPGSFLDGLLAALEALETTTTPTPTVSVDQSSAKPAVITPAAVACAPVAASADTSPAVPQVAVAKSAAVEVAIQAAVDTTPVVAAVTAVVTVSDPSGKTTAVAQKTHVSSAATSNDSTEPVAPVESLGAATPSVAVTPAVKLARSVSPHPGGHQTLHTGPVESLDAPRWAPNTPQSKTVGAQVADVATVILTATATATATAAAGVAPVQHPAAKDDKANAPAAKVAKTKAALVAATDGVVKPDAVATVPVVAAAVKNAPTADKPSRAHDETGAEPVDATHALIDDGAQLPQHEIVSAKSSGPTPVAIDHVHHTAAPWTVQAGAQSSSALPATAAKASTTTTTTAATASGASHVPPANLGMIGVDRVRFAREQAPSRALQRLSIDLDGVQVAVRFRGDRVAVDVVNDPAGTLGNGWARQVERSLDQAVRTVNEPQRGGQSTDQQGSPTGGSGGRGAGANDGSEHDRQRPGQRAFTLFDEEED
ncbi:MAG: hypothetical protein ACXWBO_11135 [Ilumatobacteraceae bacterium]